MSKTLPTEYYRVSELIRMGYIRIRSFDNSEDPRLLEASNLLAQANDHFRRCEFAHSLRLSEAVHALLNEVQLHGDSRLETPIFQNAKAQLLGRILCKEDADVLADILVLERAANALSLEGRLEEAAWMISQAERVNL